MKENVVTRGIAKRVATWLMKDIRLNAEAASSGHMFEPELPQGIKSYGKHNDDIKAV